MTATAYNATTPAATIRTRHVAALTTSAAIDGATIRTRHVAALAAFVACVACAPAAVAPTVNQPPVPILDVAASAHVGESVHVDGNASTDLDGAVSDAFILFGDGSDPVVGFTADHAFETRGAFLVELYIDDDKGATARARSRIDVTAP